MPGMQQRSPIGSVVAVVAAYEVVADVVNISAGEPVVPSFLAVIERFDLRRAVLRPPPKWVAPAGFVVMGAVAGAIFKKKSA